MSYLANSIDRVSKTVMCGGISTRQRILILHALPCQQATSALKPTDKWVP
jgi:hypothetical protein